MALTISAMRKIDLGEGLGILSSAVDKSSGARSLRFASDPKGAKSISPVYKYITIAWNLPNSVSKRSGGDFALTDVM